MTNILYYDSSPPRNNNKEQTENPIYLSSHFKPDTILWRYISTEQFLSMLSTKSLYFPRLDTLEDPFEGYPFYSDDEEYKNILQLKRKLLFVNCWHENKKESEYMWKHHGNENSIAIKTTVESFINSIDNDTAAKPGVNIVRVKYISTQEEDIDVSDDKIVKQTFYPHFYKRKQFNHEQEVRVVCRLDLAYSTLSIEKYYETLKQHPKGFYFPVCLDSLIEEIVVAPTSGRWYYDLISDTLHQYELNPDKLRKSAIQTSPLWNHDSFTDLLFNHIEQSTGNKPFYEIQVSPETRKFTISPSGKIELAEEN